jgi:electron transport complex protein RnfC
LSETVIMKQSTFERGIHPAYHKELSAERAITLAPVPKSVFIPLRQHIGAECIPLVKKGDVVVEGQKIGEAKSFVSAPVHASVGGKVKNVDPVPFSGGGKVMAVEIETAPDFQPRDWRAEEKGRVSIDSMSVDEIRQAVREAGIVGMGGAAFPSSVKLSPPKDKRVDAVIVNGCECEPFLSADHRLMVERTNDVLHGLKAMMRCVNADKAYFGIEDNKPDAIKAIEAAAREILPSLKVVPLETKYPQGAEKMLIKAVLGRTVPAGKLPFDVGVLVHNVGTAVAVYEAAAFGKPLVERVVTVSGNGVERPANLMTRIGTTFAFLIEACGGLKKGGEMVVINGGPMMGIAQTTLDVPVIKGTSGITVLSAKEIKPPEYMNCIKCASCVDACPMALVPYRLADLGRIGMLDGFKEWGAMNCIECGCCSFVCPSKRPLVHWIRVGKVKLREAESAAQAAAAAKAS